uniref:Uncharacterized protein n=1 Tax=Rhizophora mucronata TaxID=61149 RepID=A0A2P2N449_RHIMU
MGTHPRLIGGYSSRYFPIPTPRGCCEQ